MLVMLCSILLSLIWNKDNIVDTIVNNNNNIIIIFIIIKFYLYVDTSIGAAKRAEMQLDEEWHRCSISDFVCTNDNRDGLLSWDLSTVTASYRKLPQVSVR